MWAYQSKQCLVHGEVQLADLALQPRPFKVTAEGLRELLAAMSWCRVTIDTNARKAKQYKVASSRFEDQSCRRRTADTSRRSREIVCSRRIHFGTKTIPFDGSSVPVPQ